MLLNDSIARPGWSEFIIKDPSFRNVSTIYYSVKLYWLWISFYTWKDSSHPSSTKLVLTVLRDIINKFSPHAAIFYPAQLSHWQKFLHLWLNTFWQHRYICKFNKLNCPVSSEKDLCLKNKHRLSVFGSFLGCCQTLRVTISASQRKTKTTGCNWLSESPQRMMLQSLQPNHGSLLTPPFLLKKNLGKNLFHNKICKHGAQV